MVGSDDGSPEGVTTLLRAAGDGDASARDRLFAMVYDELRRMARAQLRRAPRERTLGTTALVHEAYVKLSGDAHWSTRDRCHFFALTSRAMRQILVDQARRRTREKRGGGGAPLDLEQVDIAAGERAGELVALDAALEELEKADPEGARVVEWRFFGGLSIEEIASALEVSDRTVKRQFRAARAFLFDRLSAPRDADPRL